MRVTVAKFIITGSVTCINLGLNQVCFDFFCYEDLVIFKSLHTNFFHFFKDVFKVVLDLSHFFYRQNKNTAVLVTNCRRISSSMLWTNSLNLCKDITITKVTTFSVLDDSFKTWLLKLVLFIVFLFLLHLFFMDDPKKFFVFNKIVGVNPKLDLTGVNKIYSLWWITLLVKQLSGTKIDWF